MLDTVVVSGQHLEIAPKGLRLQEILITQLQRDLRDCGAVKGALAQVDDLFDVGRDIVHLVWRDGQIDVGCRLGKGIKGDKLDVVHPQVVEVRDDLHCHFQAEIYKQGLCTLREIHQLFQRGSGNGNVRKDGQAAGRKPLPGGLIVFCGAAGNNDQIRRLNPVRGAVFKAVGDNLNQFSEQRV